MDKDISPRYSLPEEESAESGNLRIDLASPRCAEVDVLFDQALDLPPEKRPAFLEAACKGDVMLRRTVETLLFHAEEGEGRTGFPEGFLEERPLGLDGLLQQVAEGLEKELEDPLTDQRIGPYQIIDEVGRGGMGVVYRAERAEGPFSQEVAIKLLPRGRDTAALLRRFEQEQRVLALLNHPHVARLLDGGLAEGGRPYFVMEYVDGEPLDAYCDRHRLSIGKRLRLFLAVCEAVQFAHQNLIVHRDLKPSNILVASPTEEGGRPEVKLLDFGIAKLLRGEGESSAHEALTRTGERLLTPEYAAPEQIRGEAVTTATDAYSLGVLLYELLTGQRPCSTTGRSRYEVEQAVCKTEPTRPSTAVTRPSGEAGAAPAPSPEAVGRARRLRVDQLQRALRGDLDAICLKALRKEPGARYASAEALAEDVRRYLSGQPVQARRGSVGYRAGKYVQRHRWGVAVAALFVLLLAGYALTVTMHAKQIREALARERAEKTKSEQVTAYVTDLFGLADPHGSSGEVVSMGNLLERGAELAERRLEGQPEVQAELMNVRGQIYRKSGLFEKSHSFLEAALELRRSVFEDPHPALATSLNELALTLSHTGDYEAARSLLNEALAMWRTLPGDRMEEAKTLSNLARVLKFEGKYEQAEAYYREALAMQRQEARGDHDDVALTLNNFAVLLENQGRYVAAESLYVEALTMQQRMSGENHVLVGLRLSNLGAIKMRLEQYDVADSLYRRALTIQQDVLGPDHHYVAATLKNMGSLLRLRGDLDEAEPYLRKALAIQRRVYGNVNFRVAVSYYDLGVLLHVRGDYAAADSAYSRVLEIDSRLYPDDHIEIGKDLTKLAELAYDQGDIAEADRRYRRAIAGLRKAAPTSTSMASALLGYSLLMIKQARLSEAESLLREALAIRQASFPEGHSERAEARGVLGVCLAQLGRYKEAETHLQEAYAALQMRNQGDRYREVVLEGLVDLYKAWGKPDRAASYRAILAGGK